jgi:hypothetical protein
MMTSEERVQEVLKALLPLRIGMQVRVIACDHEVHPGSISKLLDCAGLQSWMVGATGKIVSHDKQMGAEWLVKFDVPLGSGFPRQWWVGAHQIEVL